MKPIAPIIATVFTVALAAAATNTAFALVDRSTTQTADVRLSQPLPLSDAI